MKTDPWTRPAAGVAGRCCRSDYRSDTHRGADRDVNSVGRLLPNDFPHRSGNIDSVTNPDHHPHMVRRPIRCVS